VGETVWLGVVLHFCVSSNKVAVKCDCLYYKNSWFRATQWIMELVRHWEWNERYSLIVVRSLSCPLNTLSWVVLRTLEIPLIAQISPDLAIWERFLSKTHDSCDLICCMKAAKYLMLMNCKIYVWIVSGKRIDYRFFSWIIG